MPSTSAKQPRADKAKGDNAFMGGRVGSGLTGGRPAPRGSLTGGAKGDTPAGGTDAQSPKTGMGMVSRSKR